MTTDIEKCKAILRTVKETNNHLTVTFVGTSNPSSLRQAADIRASAELPIQSRSRKGRGRGSSPGTLLILARRFLLQVQNVIAEGKIGKVLSVHFEWLLNTVHGADVSGV